MLSAGAKRPTIGVMKKRTHLLITALLLVFVSASSLFADAAGGNNISVTIATTFNADMSFLRFSMDENDDDTDTDTDIALNIDLGLLFTKHLGCDFYYGYSQADSVNIIRPAFQFFQQLGSKGWGLRIITGPSFQIYSDETYYGIDGLLYLEYRFEKQVFLRAGGGPRIWWDGDDNFHMSVLIPEIGVGFQF